MTSLEEKVNGIIEGVSAEFNNMTYEERKRIKKYTSYMQPDDYCSYGKREEGEKQWD